MFLGKFFFFSVIIFDFHRFRPAVISFTQYFMVIRIFVCLYQSLCLLFLRLLQASGSAPKTKTALSPTGFCVPGLESRTQQK